MNTLVWLHVVHHHVLLHNHTFSISSTVDMSLFTLAVVTVAVGTLDDTSRSLSTVPMTMAVPIAAVGLSGLEVERCQDEGEEDQVEGDTLHLGGMGVDAVDVAVLDVAVRTL